MSPDRAPNPCLGMRSRAGSERPPTPAGVTTPYSHGRSACVTAGRRGAHRSTATCPSLPPPPLTGPSRPPGRGWPAARTPTSCDTCSASGPSTSPRTSSRSPPLDRGSPCTSHRPAEPGGARRELPDPGPSGWTTSIGPRWSLAEDVVAELEARAHRPARSWANERAALLAELDRWLLDADASEWAGRSFRSPSGVRHDGDVVPRPPRRPAVWFAGQVDRIDELPDGTLVVTDHKTGGATSGQAGGRTTRRWAGRGSSCRCTPPPPGCAGRPDAPVRAEYAFFDKGSFQRIGSRSTTRSGRRSRGDLAHVVDGIEAGFFPARPDPPAGGVRGLPLLRARRAGHGERWAEWERKRHDPRLARWFAERRDASERMNAQLALASTPRRRRPARRGGPRRASATTRGDSVRRGRRRGRQDAALVAGS